MKNPLKCLKPFDIILWCCSVGAVIVSFFIGGAENLLSLVASLVGVTALILIARGHVVGQMLMICFAILYGIISLEQRYFGEMITYVGMSMPMAVAATVSWLRHPYDDTSEVRVNRLTRKAILPITLASTAVSIAFYFILGALGNASLIVSTLSVTTSFLAASFSFLRSPYFAVAYAANDLVLIILWSIAAVTDPSAVAMIICFVTFLVNDLYSFLCWRTMERRQFVRDKANGK